MKRLLICLLFLSASSAMAVDGVIEINQLCVQFGCFDGDSGGFPVTITNSGSYRLTSNLDVSSLPTPENVSAINISSNLVTVDLNGFSIIGPTVCTGPNNAPVDSCTPTGGGIGVNASSSARNVEIKNGYIRGMGGAGVTCTGGCRVSHIVAIENGVLGISNSNEDAILINNIARRNGGDGFFVAGQVDNNISSQNLGRGIFANPGSRLTNNNIQQNGGNGVRCFTCSLSNNIILSNDGFGVDYGGRSVAGGNLIDGNDLGEINGTAPFEIAPNRCGFAACP